MICKNCGADMPKDTYFCEKCGEAMYNDMDYPSSSRRDDPACETQPKPIGGIWFCTSCGRENSPAQNYCPACGRQKAELRPSAPSPSTLPPPAPMYSVDFTRPEHTAPPKVQEYRASIAPAHPQNLPQNKIGEFSVAMHSGPAVRKLAIGGMVNMGKLSIYADRFEFKPGAVNFIDKPLTIPVAEVASVSVTNVALVIPNGILIKLRSGMEHLFVPYGWEKKRIVDMLNAQVSGR